MQDNFIPDHLLLEMIYLLDRCKCELCQSEKRKREQQLSNVILSRSDISEVKENI